LWGRCHDAPLLVLLALGGVHVHVRTAGDKWKTPAGGIQAALWSLRISVRAALVQEAWSTLGASFAFSRELRDDAATNLQRLKISGTTAKIASVNPNSQVC
jgi:hypothetical protein